MPSSMWRDGAGEQGSHRRKTRSTLCPLAVAAAPQAWAATHRSSWHRVLSDGATASLGGRVKEWMARGVQGGLVTCGRPIIKSAAPSLCNTHLQRSQKSIAQAYRKVGFNPALTSKVTPKFSVLVAEFVRQIQGKRRQALKAAERQKCPKDGEVD
nr:unnamed protein product [Digitaria exilis]